MKAHETTTNRQMYVRFLHATLMLEAEKKLQDIDLMELKLLEMLAVASEAEKPMNVGEAMSADWIASPATLHRKIRSLIDTGYVSSEFFGRNRRTRYLVPTEKANAFFSQMGTSMKLCMSEV